MIKWENFIMIHNQTAAGKHTCTCISVHTVLNCLNNFDVTFMVSHLECFPMANLIPISGIPVSLPYLNVC